MSAPTVYGNRISLISKSGIRYIGTLNDVNEQEQTISLEQVRSMGTEGRKGNPLEEIPPSNDVYEYIQFRATDVTSVQFETEAPPPPAAPPVPNDPAILDARAQPKEQAPPPTQQPAPQPHQTNVAPVAAAPEPQAHRQAHTQQPLREEQPINASATQTAAPRDMSNVRDSYNTNNIEQTNSRQGTGYAPRGGYSYRGTRGGIQRGGYRRGGYQGRGGYHPRNNGRHMEIPDSDFDFESSNSKLNKDDIAKEFINLSIKVTEADEPDEADVVAQTPSNATNEGKAVAPAYKPQKSFFDDISCEAKERIQIQERGLSYQERRSRLNAERQQNFETFGQATIEQSRYRYNRYNRGGRGGYNANGNNGWRGNNRGYSRGSYNNSNNRSYNRQGQNHTSAPGTEGYVESGAQA